MKNIYESPELNIDRFLNVDVMTESAVGGDNDVADPWA